jgi:hypothetical protein
VRRPYCNLCRSWYRLVWEGPLDPRRAAAARTAGLLPDSAECHEGRIATWSCRGGCQPARVDLSWREKSAAGRSTTRRAVAWLAPQQVMELVQAEAAFAPPAPPR